MDQYIETYIRHFLTTHPGLLADTTIGEMNFSARATPLSKVPYQKNEPLNTNNELSVGCNHLVPN